MEFTVVAKCADLKFQLHELFLDSPYGCDRFRLLFHVSRRFVEWSNAFKISKFGKLLVNNKLNISDPRLLPRDAAVLLPFLFVADGAFALSGHVCEESRG